MRIVIMGASGNLGTALLDRIRRDRTDVDVVAVARRIPAAEPPYDTSRWVAVDVTGENAAGRLAGVFRGADAVVNLVWGFQPARDPERLAAVGVGGLTAVLAAAREAAVPHLVHVSSVGAYRAGPIGPAGKERVDESWPTDGIATSVYSRQKAAAERLLDRAELEQTGRDPVITRLRPGLVLQRAAGSSLLRYGAPALLPSWAPALLPVLPVGRSLTVPVVHADDVAAALLAAVDRRAAGPFNLAGDPPITGVDIADRLRAWSVDLPPSVIGRAARLAFAARVSRIDAGWLDLAYAVPLLDTTRAREVLGWEPGHGSLDALDETVAGVRAAEATGSPALRRRTVLNQLTDRLADGPITRRRVS